MRPSSTMRALACVATLAATCLLIYVIVQGQAPGADASGATRDGQLHARSHEHAPPIERATETARRTRVAVHENAPSPMAPRSVSSDAAHPHGTWRFSVATPRPFRRPAGHEFVAEIPGTEDQPWIELVRGRTDKNGIATIDWVPGPEFEWDEIDDVIKCRVTDPGFFDSVSKFRSRGSSDRPRPCAYLQPKPGAEVCVQLVDVIGNDVPGTFIIETPPGAPSGEEWLLETDTRGFARVGVPGDLEATLHGIAAGFGTATIRFEDLAQLGDMPRPVPLVVSGAASIAGVLLSAAGEPMPGVTLHLRAMGEDETIDASNLTMRSMRSRGIADNLVPSYDGDAKNWSRATPGVGTTSALLTTNERGEFSTSGLAAAEFAVHVQEWFSASLIGHLPSSPHPERTILVWNRVYVRVVVESNSTRLRKLGLEVWPSARNEFSPRLTADGEFITSPAPPRIVSRASTSTPSAPIAVRPGVNYVLDVVEATGNEPSDMPSDLGPVRAKSQEFTVDASQHEWVIRVHADEGDWRDGTKIFYFPDHFRRTSHK